MSKPRRIKITGFHKEDAFYGDKHDIGMTGMFVPEPPHLYPGYYGGQFNKDGRDNWWTFIGVRYIKL